MSLTSAFLDTLQQQANVANTRAQTQQRLQTLTMNQQKMDQQNTMASLLQNINQNQVDEVVTADDGTMAPLDSKNPYVATLKSAQGNVKSAIKDVAIAAASGNYDEYAKAKKELFNQQKEYRLAQAELYKDQQSKMKEAAQTFGGVDTLDDVQNALRWVNDNVSPAAAKKAGQQISQALQMPLAQATPSDFRKAVAPIANQYVTMGEQLREKESQRASQDRSNSLKERIRSDFARERDAGVNISLRRENLQRLKDKDVQKAKGLATDHQIQQMEDKEQASLNKDKAVDSFWKVQKGYQSARDVTQVVAQRGFTSITEPEARRLNTEYTQMVNNYRSLVGSKWTDQQQKDFDSVFDKAQGFLKTIGEGKKFSPHELEVVAASINDMYQNANKEVVKRTLRAQDKVYRRGGDPTIITGPASLDQALKQPGVDRVVDPDTGDEYIRFGPNKEDVFPLHNRPKRKSQDDEE
ncbi:MAG: hypothetical protein ACREO5_00090 [Candidatus Binatia bacterium]